MKIVKTLKELAEPLPVKKMIGDAAVSSMTMDSREVEKGALFFCIRGYTVDGHDYAQSAEAAGAAAIVAEKKLDLAVPQLIVPDSSKAMAVMAARFYEHPSSALSIIGVTGTNGKTTVTHFLEQLYRTDFGLIGTMYTRFPGWEEPSVNTTPASVELQRLLRRMVDAGATTTAMEVSSHALQLGRVHGTNFNTAVFTNLTQDHLDFHPSMESYAHAKSLLFAQLGSGEATEGKYGIVNVDDPWGEVMIASCAVPVLSYGIDKPADVQALNLRLTPSGSVFDLRTPAGETSLELQVPGKFSVYNALAAAAAAAVTGLGWETVIKRLPGLKGVRGRFEPVESVAPVHVIVDYAHTPDSLVNVLQTISGMTDQRIITVVGCGGDRDVTKRPLMASAAEEGSDYVILTSDNPRSEDPASIINHMEAGITGSYEVEADRRKAIASAVARAGKGDVILIAGKGHETYQEINQVRHPFDDREEAAAALKEWSPHDTFSDQ
ncbi:UDP-N-acetylmuramoyl-L-alanyl-D-glutamate--2,6-diaminopimelate ligase [Alkalicoccus chagannorensis]|uniref:UDP-N-acetylmuramoyl-L-alanyl-D-glutamate--2, 6-diaminopimelate ligase n=1 Tax=Alkalicoccus chagannorensis TaxID=427072 RepID=UPI00047A4B60|nr:UDP-N-acetylmuramoyl-L-alanyl-D-glutamate--2,6-diaminopimelate ligase [Alkalicoccus chagannorensis]